MRRIDGRTIWRAWKAVRDAGLDVFEPGSAERLPRVPGWSAFRLPPHDLVGVPAVAVLDALRALSLLEHDRPRDTGRARLVATLPGGDEAVLATRDVVRSLILSAQEELLVLGFAIREEDVKELLVRRGEAGVRVTVVGDRTDGGSRDLFHHWPSTAAPLVALENVAPAPGQPRQMHAKVIVADRSRALIGSANFTFSGLSSNFEFGVSVEGEAAAEVCRVVERLQRRGWLVPVT